MLRKYIRDEKPSTQGGNALQQYVPIAQMVEHMTFNHRVESSNLSRHTSHNDGKCKFDTILVINTY